MPDEGDLRISILGVCEATSQIHNPSLKKDIYNLERTQRAATRCVKGLRDLNYEDRLKALKLQFLEKINTRNDLARLTQLTLK